MFCWEVLSEVTLPSSHRMSSLPTTMYLTLHYQHYQHLTMPFLLSQVVGLENIINMYDWLAKSSKSIANASSLIAQCNRYASPIRSQTPCCT